MPAVHPATKKSPRIPHLSVVLPVYNEEKNIRLQYEEIVTALKPLGKTYEVIFIDDGSTDGSRDILRDIARNDKNIKLVLFRRNFGQTAAMSAGIDFATGEITIFMDSDLQNDPRDIGMLMKKIEEGYDVVSGWRKKRMDRLFSRKIPSQAANWLIAKVTGVKLHDLGCSLKAYRSDLLKQVNLYGEMHRFIPVHASWLGARITEVPVNHHPRKYGASKYGMKRTFKVLLDLITVTFLGKYSTKPIYVFGGTGLLLLMLGGMSGIAVIVMKIVLHQSMNRNPLLILTVMLAILSVLFIQIGILAEILIRIYHESQNKQPYSVLETMNIKKK
ncbi:MAG: glycosyltransferase [Spirochaetes bacterium]|nr:glycosyltransferase [Spirochaetota bacterium]